MPIIQGLPPEVTNFAEYEAHSELEPYSAGEEKLKIAIGSRGIATIVHDGNGDPTLETRIYTDGVLKGRSSCNEKSIFHAKFNSKLEVKVYSEIDQEAKNSNVYIIVAYRRV